jgi:ABC-type Zn uptake system ZnuABC Zn-binding protein ZnuA
LLREIGSGSGFALERADAWAQPGQHGEPRHGEEHGEREEAGVAEPFGAEARKSARDVARIITQVKKQKTPAVFLENVADPRLMERIAQETGARVGGTLYSDALTGEKGDAPTYIELMRHNVKQLAAALMG